jgi:hypothetical protein
MSKSLLIVAFVGNSLQHPGGIDILMEYAGR